MMRTLVFLPAWNEQDSVVQTLAEIREELPGVELLVIDDGSDDSTVERVRAAGVTVAPFPFHIGIGAAVHAGYLYAAREGYDYCAHLDADGQHPAGELHKLLSAVQEGRCDLAVGSRYLESGGHPGSYSAPFLRRVGIALFRRLLSWQTGARFTDTTSGFRAANKRMLCFFAFRYASDYPELESLQNAVAYGFKVCELAVWVRPRTIGRSKITPLQSLHFVWKSLFAIALGFLPRHRASAYLERKT
jgi:hypothetical protein